MNWGEIVVGQSYEIKARLIQDDDREFLGIHVLHKNTNETAHGRTRKVIGRLFTFDGSLSKQDNIEVYQDSLVRVWVKTDAQKANEAKANQEWKDLQELVKSRCAELIDLLSLRGIKAITNDRKIEIGAGLHDNTDQLQSAIQYLDKLADYLQEGVLTE